MVVCDKWVAVKVFEVLFCVACLVCKRVTDDESVRLALYLQKISREWSLLRNITWDSIGASFGDAVYGGYVIITVGLLLAKIFREIPRGRRVLEGFLLGIGALFFIVLGGLELASLDSIPDGLIDNAAVLGVLSLVTAALFLIDLAGPRRRITSKHSQTDVEKSAGSYPKLPPDQKKSTPLTDTNSLRPKFFPEKFMKSKKDDKKAKSEQAKDVSKVTELAEPAPSHVPTTIENEAGNFVPSETNGYHKFSEQNTDAALFETIERSKYGSVRNGDIKRSNMTEESTFQQMSAVRPNGFHKPFTSINTINTIPEHDEDMHKNISYLKMLDARNLSKKQTERKDYEEDLAKLNEQYIKEYQQRISDQEVGDRKNYPRMGLSRPEYEKQKHWEKFEEEQLPPFPVKADYLPEIQTPVFARIKEKRSNKSYGVYDNLSLYNIQQRSDNGSQTDTLKSKMSTLRSSKPPTLQQIAEYFGLQQKQPSKIDNKREVASQVDNNELPAVSFMLPMAGAKKDDDDINYNGGPSSPTDPGYVQYTAQQWNDRLHRKYSTRTPRHSPTEG